VSQFVIALLPLSVFALIGPAFEQRYRLAKWSEWVSIKTFRAIWCANSVKMAVPKEANRAKQTQTAGNSHRGLTRPRFPEFHHDAARYTR